MPRTKRSAPPVRLTGLSVDRKFVHVGFTFDEGVAARFHVVKVPLTNLLHEDVIDALDAAARERLNRKWDRAFEQTALFEVPNT